MRSTPIYSLIDLARQERDSGAHSGEIAAALDRLASLLPEAWERTGTDPETLQVRTRPLPDKTISAAQRTMQPTQWGFDFERVQ